MEKQSVSYSTNSRVFLNKTINSITKISFHKHFNIITVVCVEVEEDERLYSKSWAFLVLAKIW
jgi:hypothetical protein